MKMKTRKLLIGLLAGVALAGWALPATAVSLNLMPASQAAMPGDAVSLDLMIAGLTAGGPDSLGDFDIDIAFDPAALSLTGFTLGAFLGDIGLGEALDVSLGDLGGGTVNVAELSLLAANAGTGPGTPPLGPYLDDIQPASFSLATLMFSVDVLPPGASTVVAIDRVWAVGDGLGEALTLDATSDALIYNPIPEPGTMLLLGSGLVGLAGWRRRRSRSPGT